MNDILNRIKGTVVVSVQAMPNEPLYLEQCMIGMMKSVVNGGAGALRLAGARDVKNAKKLFLSYSDIFPYVGTYKALMNAVNVLGYTDLFFKEWYKDLNKSKDFDAGYVAYDMSYKADSNINSIMNINLEERIKLKKLNWISMFYRINEELTNECNDEYG